ncbi:MAG: PfkB family carbohydrate kinase [Candidatus Gastranaerophilales bacterium]|nr:PfkB family carbohydrate kinase [Candidatus Gastranaerophilales bacterium]
MFTFDKNKLKSIIHNLNKGRVLVIGDFAIDEMIYGQTHRISREAPVLILKHTHTNIILGGASNAAHNISTLNAGKVAAIGLYGDDYHGPILLNTLNDAKIDTSYMVQDSSRVTTTKTRISGSSTQSVTQQIVRIDREVNNFISSKIESKVIDNIKKIASNFDAILLSDYNIGMMTPAVIEESIKIGKENGLIVAVDAQENLGRFKGATVMTPNQPDSEKTLGYLITDHDILMKAGKDLLDKTLSDMILLTRGGEGMVLFDKDGTVSSIPAFNKTDVFDVTGAGDTVVSSFTLALCAGANGAEATFIGNLAASIVVKHFGCATTTIDELDENLQKLDMKNLSLKA